MIKYGEKNDESRSWRKIVVGNEAFVTESGKRLSNKRFANAREKNAIAYTMAFIIDRFFSPRFITCRSQFRLCYRWFFHVPRTRYVNACSSKSTERQKHKTWTMFYLSVLLSHIILVGREDNIFNRNSWKLFNDVSYLRSLKCITIKNNLNLNLTDVIKFMIIEISILFSLKWIIILEK